jgi:GGDEF domain-containing protein
MTGEKNQGLIDSISAELRRQNPNCSQTVIDAMTFKQFKDKYEYDKMETIRQKAVKETDVENDK